MMDDGDLRRDSKDQMISAVEFLPLVRIFIRDVLLFKSKKNLFPIDELIYLGLQIT